MNIHSLFLLVFLSLYTQLAFAQTKVDTFRVIDSLVIEQLKQWNVPGVSLTIVKDNQVFLTKGYGLRDLITKAPVDEHTLFGIASCSKAFTAAGVALLVEAGELEWDKPLIEYLPDFKMMDTFTQQRIAIRDLLCHRSGLPRHDMIWHNSGFDRNQIYERLKYLPSSEPLYKKFQYNNVMYIASGVVIEKMANTNYEDWMTEKLLQPLDMKETIWFDKDLRASSNYAIPYILIEDEPTPAPIFAHDDVTNAAGGIKTSAKDMANWLLFQLNDGRLEGKQVVKPELVQEMQKAHILVREANAPEKGAVLYGLGWNISTYRDKKLIYHQGARAGYWSHISFLPTENFGIYVNSNIDGNSIHFVEMLANSLTDYLLKYPNTTNWVTHFQGRQDNMERQFQNTTAKKLETITPKRDLNKYIGSYKHPAFGIIEVGLDEEQLIAHFRMQDFHLQSLGDDHFSGNTAIDHFTFHFLTTDQDNINGLQSILQGVPIIFDKMIP